VALFLVGPWGPALAAGVFSVLVMGLGGTADPGLRDLAEQLAATGQGGVVAGAGVVAAGAGVAVAPDRRLAAIHAASLLPSLLVSVAAATALAGLPDTYAWDGEWSPAGRTARTWAVWTMITGFVGLASLRMWRRHASACAAEADLPLEVTPDDRRGYLVAAGLSAVVLVGWLVG